MKTLLPCNKEICAVLKSPQITSEVIKKSKSPKESIIKLSSLPPSEVISTFEKYVSSHETASEFETRVLLAKTINGVVTSVSSTETTSKFNTVAPTGKKGSISETSETLVETTGELETLLSPVKITSEIETSVPKSKTVDKINKNEPSAEETTCSSASPITLSMTCTTPAILVSSLSTTTVEAAGLRSTETERIESLIPFPKATGVTATLGSPFKKFNFIEISARASEATGKAQSLSSSSSETNVNVKSLIKHFEAANTTKTLLSFPCKITKTIGKTASTSKLTPTISTTKISSIVETSASVPTVPGKIEAIKPNQSPSITGLIEVPFEITDIEASKLLLKSTCGSRNKTITTKSATLANLSHPPETASSSKKCVPLLKAVNFINNPRISPEKTKAIELSESCLKRASAVKSELILSVNTTATKRAVLFPETSCTIKTLVPTFNKTNIVSLRETSCTAETSISTSSKANKGVLLETSYTAETSVSTSSKAKIVSVPETISTTEALVSSSNKANVLSLTETISITETFGSISNKANLVSVPETITTVETSVSTSNKANIVSVSEAIFTTETSGSIFTKANIVFLPETIFTSQTSVSTSKKANIISLAETISTTKTSASISNKANVENLKINFPVKNSLLSLETSFATNTNKPFSNDLSPLPTAPSAVQTVPKTLQIISNPKVAITSTSPKLLKTTVSHTKVSGEKTNNDVSSQNIETISFKGITRRSKKSSSFRNQLEPPTCLQSLSLAAMHRKFKSTSSIYSTYCRSSMIESETHSQTDTLSLTQIYDSMRSLTFASSSDHSEELSDSTFEHLFYHKMVGLPEIETQPKSILSHQVEEAKCSNTFNIENIIAMADKESLRFFSESNFPSPLPLNVKQSFKINQTRDFIAFADCVIIFEEDTFDMNATVEVSLYFPKEVGGVYTVFFRVNFLSWTFGGYFCTLNSLISTL